MVSKKRSHTERFKMIGFLKGKAISQIDKVLIDGKEYTDEQIKDLVKRFNKEITPVKKSKK